MLQSLRRPAVQPRRREHGSTHMLRKQRRRGDSRTSWTKRLHSKLNSMRWRGRGQRVAVRLRVAAAMAMRVAAGRVRCRVRMRRSFGRLEALGLEVEGVRSRGRGTDRLRVGIGADSGVRIQAMAGGRSGAIMLCGMLRRAVCSRLGLRRRRLREVVEVKSTWASIPSAWRGVG